MQNHRFSKLNDFSNYSKEELLDIIKELQQENASLLSNSQTTLSKAAQMSFRQQYAEQILDSLPDMLTVITDDGITVAIVSAEETNHTGISRDDIHGVPVKTFLPPHVCAHVMESVEQAIAHGKSANLNHLMYVDGKPHYFENRTVRLYHDHNLCLCRDITEEMLAKIQLESLNYAVNLVDENIFSLNSEGEFIFVNKQFMKDHHQQKSVVGESAIGVLFSCQTKEEWAALKTKIYANNGVTRYVYQHLNSDENKISYEVIAHSSRNINNDEEFWFFARNITASLEQKSKINDLNELLNAILSNIPVYLFVKDSTDFKYLYWNKALEELTGIPSDNAVGHTDTEIFSNSLNIQTFSNNDFLVLDHKNKIEQIKELINVNGEKRIVKTIKTSVERLDNNPLIIGVSLDITDIKIVEKELIAAKLEAEKSNQLKSAFLANMSHEIRTPLNAIVGFSKLIMTEEDVESRSEYSDIINHNADLLLQLINDILDLSKIEAGTLDFVIKEMNLDELCNNMLEVHKMRAHEGLTIIYEGEGKPLMIESDWNRLSQVFTNLLSNAIKFTPSGEVRFGFSVKNNRIEAYVRDTGMGISADKLSNIFDRFIKLNNFVQGTGLGLSITKTIIERLEGTIEVTSEKGKGTEFKFTIPYNSPLTKMVVDEAPAVKITKPEKFTESKKRGILIAEDTESNYILLKKLIGTEYTYYHARTGVEAVDLFSKHTPDIVFMDIKMPVMNGLDAIKIIRTISTDVPIIVLTAFDYSGDEENAFQAGCNHFLMKPMKFDQIESIKNKYLK